MLSDVYLTFDSVEHFDSVDNSVLPPEGSLPPNSVIHLDDLPWHGWIDPRTNERAPGMYSKVVVDPRSRNSAALVHMQPEYSGGSHWHPSDTLYIIRSGELHLEGEGIYRPGDVRWVRGGTGYAPEASGSEPMEMFVISFGPGGRFDADKVPPPQGWARGLNRH